MDHIVRNRKDFRILYNKLRALWKARTKDEKDLAKRKIIESKIRFFLK